MDAPILEFKGVCKSFGEVKVLKNIDLSIKQGEVFALMGENGAGKSTLMKILSGAYSLDSGEIYINGSPVNIANPSQALDHGISIIYQELSVIPTLTVVENIFLGRLLKKKSGLLDWAEMQKQSLDAIKQVNLNISPNTVLSTLSVAQRQLIEIARAVSLKAKVVIMDEPTSSLSENEIKMLFQIIDSLKKQGVTIIYISHKLEEIMEICDRIAVLKDGSVTGISYIKDTDKDQIVNWMVGRNIEDYYPKRKPYTRSQNPVLKVEHFSDNKVVKDVNFDAYGGEILGIYGLVGSGRTETMRAIFGADKRSLGNLYLNGEKINIRSPQEAIQHGIVLCTEDRRNEGLISIFSIKNNVTLANFPSMSKNGFINHKTESSIAEHYVDAMKIKTGGIQTQVQFLSGGNQQKVVIGKWLNTHSDVYIFDEPTRGVDVGAKVDIYQLMIDLADDGKTVIMVSSELPEILGVSDRIMVMCEGEITYTCKNVDITEEHLIKYAIRGGH